MFNLRKLFRRKRFTEEKAMSNKNELPNLDGLRAAGVNGKPTAVPDLPEVVKVETMQLRPPCPPEPTEPAAPTTAPTKPAIGVTTRRVLGHPVESEKDWNRRMRI